jgi:hypothetical protein
MVYPFKNNPTQKINQIQIIKKKTPKLKLTHLTQIKLTLKLNSNSLHLFNKPPYSAISPLTSCLRFLSLRTSNLCLRTLSEMNIQKQGRSHLGTKGGPGPCRL